MTDPDSTVLVVGAGLTMCDVVATLRRRNHRGRIHVVSRRAMLPRCQGPFDDDFQVFGPEGMPRTALSLLRHVRRQVESGEETGVTWHAVIDSVRRSLSREWRNLPRQEARQIARWLKPYWDVHRFRMAPQVAEMLNLEIQAGRLVLSAGSVQGIDARDGRLRVEWRPRNSEVRQDTVDLFVNCTGPSGDISRSGNPLLSNLFDQGIIRSDATRSGLDVDAEGAVLARNGSRVPGLFAAGPLARGTVGEATGVPEASAHARLVAMSLVSEFRKAPSVSS